MRPFRQLSIRLRLTLGALVIAGVFFAGTAFVVRLQVEHILANSTVMLLQSDADPYVQAIADNKGASLEAPAQGQLLTVLNPAGVAVKSSLPPELTPQLPDIVTAGAATQSITTPNAEYLVVSRAVKANDGVWHVVTARNEQAAELSLANLTTALVVGLVILTLLFAGGAWLLASAAIAPVSSMRRTAVMLRERTTTELLPVGPARDELSALAVTLNELIIDLRASADREKQLVSDASHELRTPLAILQTQLELAHLSAGDSTALLAEIESAERHVKRLTVLAASLLELTRIEGMQPNESSPVSQMADELVDAIDRARMLSTGSAVLVDYEVAELSGASVALSRHNFGRIVDNLLGNAIAAIGSSGTVRAELRMLDSRLCLDITDSGPGMSAAFIPLAFDRFSREDQSRTGSAGPANAVVGTRGVKGNAGLGLSIVWALVSSAGGTVTLANRSSGGLRVAASIPTIVSVARTERAAP
ncbi:sensor histidine kinase [Subtercola vilae]|uniref:histidine kinase n=1 Tax=Subtercola vilae TaxID=2056433 RepID=A0A4V6U5H9_9MICO|nr:HAMP domain-containing sensor histidine kinase [Subtercola vilae]TIH40354.1 sensor histidine kinase [Subtercola vilae]